MKLPGFTAEASLFTTADTYSHQDKFSSIHSSSISPSFSLLLPDPDDNCTIPCLERCLNNRRINPRLCSKVCSMICQQLQLPL